MFRLSAAFARAISRAGAMAAPVVVSAAVLAPSASAGPGYELDSGASPINVGGEVAHGIAIDQVSQNIYVAVVAKNIFTKQPGYLVQLNSSGVPTANSPFGTGGEDFFAGVAVNPATQGIFAYQTQIVTPQESIGESKMTAFSSSGVEGPSFSPPRSRAPQIAADASGRVYFPIDTTGDVQVYSATGELKETISCTGCPGGAFVEPNSVALDSASNLYVTDLSGGGRAIKFKPSGGSYVYDSVLQSGAGAVAVGVDPSSNDVFVGDLTDSTYHIAAYNSSGIQFDDFGGGVVGPSFYGRYAAGQLAASATTHKVYLTDPNASAVRVFKRIASIPVPTATTSAASTSSQVEATLKALVNPKGHTLTDCHFEYTDATDFAEHGFTNATSADCSSMPVGSEAVQASEVVTGLTPGTTYDYRIVVSGWGGSAQGGAQSFTTLAPLAPDATTGSASAITQTKATLAGLVNPHGGPVSDCHFEYTSDADFQTNGFANASSVECSFTPEGTTNDPVSANISGLTAGTGYRFRVVATNNVGTTEAISQTFATLADTCATNPAVCPPPTEKEHGTPVQPPAPTQPPIPLPEAKPAPKPLKCRKGFKKKNVHGKTKCVRVKKKHHRPR